MRILNCPKKTTCEAGHHPDLGGYATRVSDILKVYEMANTGEVKNGIC